VQRPFSGPPVEPYRGDVPETNALIPTRCVPKPVLTRKTEIPGSVKLCGVGAGEVLVLTRAEEDSVIQCGHEAA